MVEAFSNWKMLAAVTSMLIGLGAFLPYFIELFKRRTTPHAYTWLIWSITQGTATAGLFVGGAGLIAYGFTLGTILVGVIFLLSFRYGTKNVRPVDAIVLIAALAAVGVWTQLHQPVLAVFMVCAIDGLGYFPTYRKLYQEPWSESLLSWTMFIVSQIFSLIALQEYNLLTVPYILLCLAANIILVALSLIRRQFVLRPG